MAYLFVLIFFAAVAGIIKPYIGGSKRSHFALGALVAFVLVAVTAPSSPKPKDRVGATPADAATPGATPASASTDNGAVPAQPASNWEYSDQKDEMRGTSSKLAQVKSDNTVDLEFPYGETHGQIWIRQRAEDGLSVAFEVESGQVLCNDFGDSHVSIKFDDGPVQKFRCSGTSDGSNNVAFIDDARRALADLKKSKRAIVEAEFFEQGRKQFKFETAGLDWK